MLEVGDLTVDFPTAQSVTRAVAAVSWVLRAGEVLAVVGESGAGKSASALAIMGLLPASARVGGSVRFRGVELLGLAPKQLNAYRGRRLALIPQEPLGALNPVYPLGQQVAQAVRVHDPVSKREAIERAVELLRLVGVADAEQRLGCYPHQLSGGQRQRAVIAIALAHDPEVIIADEPTSALDVTVQAQVLQTLTRVRGETGAAMVLITHDLGVAAATADRVVVMAAGTVVETGRVDDVFACPQAPHTRRLLASVLRIDRAADVSGRPRALPAPVGDAASSATPVLAVRDLVTHFERRDRRRLSRGRRTEVHAVCGVDLELFRGETVGLVGETGCGKSTLVRSVLGLVRSTSGSVRLDGRDLGELDASQRRRVAADLQIVFQDTHAALDPRMPIGAIVAEPLRIHRRLGADGGERVGELLRAVGLAPDHRSRYPHQLSGGERQRVGIARALALEPKAVVLDEPVSALDVSVRAEVIDLLAELQERLGLAYLFVAHDLAVVRRVAHRVAVMYLGKVVETGSAWDLYGKPSHPYTQALLAAVPRPDPGIERARRPIVLHGEVPDAAAPPSGCRFRTRCPKAEDVCVHEEPALVERGQGHPVACHFAQPLDLLRPGSPEGVA